MKSTTALLLITALGLAAFRSDKPAYTLFDKEGKKVKYEKMIENISKTDVIFFGELHDNPISHWLEYEVTADLYKAAGNKLVQGAEMFEADNQLLIDEYLSKAYEADKFEAEVKLWKNYKTDYKPLVEFARKNGLPFIATNVPRRYASLVSKKGFEGLDSLPDESKRYIAPQPIHYDPEVRSYKDMMQMTGMPGMGGKVNDNFPKAQAVKDATMAHFILKNLDAGNIFIHYNGSFHSENYSGIIYYLKREMPGIRVSTITTVLQSDTDSLKAEYLNTADYIIVVPESMTRTY